MGLMQALRITPYITVLFLFLFKQNVHCASRFRQHEACCLANQLSGQLTLSQSMRDALFGGNVQTSHTPVQFSVDFSRGFLIGEHYTDRGHVQVVADVRDAVRMLYVREKLSKRCWTFPLGFRQMDPCILNEARYRGRFPYDNKKSNRKGLGLIYDRTNQSPNEDLITWLKYRSLLLVDDETCLPILDAHADDLDYYIAFHKMSAGLKGLRDIWDFELGQWVVDSCFNQGAETMEELNVGSTYQGTTSWHGPTSDDSGDRLLKKLIEIQLLGGYKHKEHHRDHHSRESHSFEEEHHHREEERHLDKLKRNIKRDINNIIQLEVYLYLLKQFFPRQPPQPCCGPQEWQASATKSITYTYVQTAYTGQSITTIPHLYVDHKNGRLYADMLEYVNGALSSNITLLALFAPGTNNNSMLSIYAIDGTGTPTCTYIQVTDVHGPMRNNCMPATAQYERTVNVGSGPLNSVRLDVYNITGSSPSGEGPMTYNAESYVTPHQCIPQMEVYQWQTPNTKVTGSIIMSNTLARIKDPSQAFTVPALCAGATPIQIPSSQIQGAMSFALSYAGF